MLKDILKPALVMIAVAFISTLLLSNVRKFTEPRIAKRIQERQNEALRLVLPGFSFGPVRTVNIDGEPFVFWIAEKSVDYTKVQGYAFIAASPGYGGDIESLVGVDEKGKILGISIVNQSETPGLGARIVEVASRETLWEHIRNGVPVRDSGDETRIPWFQNQFKGLDANVPIRMTKRGVWNPNLRSEFIKKNAISALAGATITSTAVVKSIETGMEKLKKALRMKPMNDTGGAK